MLGIAESMAATIMNYENGPLIFGTDNYFRMAIQILREIDGAPISPALAGKIKSTIRMINRDIIDAEKQSAITALAGATAHELNQPLTVILGYIELLRRRVNEADRRPLDAIASQVDEKFMSAFVRAVKPKQETCCGPACCR